MRPCGSATQWKLYQQVSNVNQANAKQVTSTASVSPVEDAVVVKYVNIGLSNGMKIEHHNLSYSGLQSFISKLQAFCLA